jgi:hypothetical protein
MRKPLLPLAFAVLGCAINPRISRMEHYAQGSKKPIIYGGIAGIPEGYTFALHFEYRDPKGQMKRVSRAFEDKDVDAKDSVFKYAFSLPPGRWALRQLDLMGLKESGESTLVLKTPKEVMAIFRMRDTISTGFEFDVANHGLYYLGRWTFGGFDSLESLLPEAIARFNGSKGKAADTSRKSIPWTLAVEDSTESDLTYFRKKNRALRSKKSLSAIPARPFSREIQTFDLLIEDPMPPPYHDWAHDFQMRHVMRPKIPKF